jgi:hypothetical protein
MTYEQLLEILTVLRNGVWGRRHEPSLRKWELKSQCRWLSSGFLCAMQVCQKSTNISEMLAASGLFPYIFTRTRHLVLASSLALPLWIRYAIFGWINNTHHTLVHFVPQGTSAALVPFIICTETTWNLLHPDDGSSKHLWNVGKLLTNYMVQQPGRQPSSYSSPYEPKISLKLHYSLRWIKVTQPTWLHNLSETGIITRKSCTMISDVLLFSSLYLLTSKHGLRNKTEL